LFARPAVFGTGAGRVAQSFGGTAIFSERVVFTAFYFDFAPVGKKRSLPGNEKWRLFMFSLDITQTIQLQ
jgi:hypothetical protein